MKKWLVGISLGLLFFAGIGFYGVYEYTGLKYYLKANREINKLEGREKEEALDVFMGGQDSGLDVYGGILMGVNTKDHGGVWVWGRHGLRYFRSDQYSVFSFFSICKPVILEKYKNGEEVKIGQDIYTDIVEWKKLIKQGDYVSLIITNKDQGGTVGNLREAKVNDWWPFVSVDVEGQCEQR